MLDNQSSLRYIVFQETRKTISYFRVFSAQTFANVFFFLILLELRVPKIRHTFLYFTLLVCLVLFNFQGPIQPPLSRQLYYFTTLLLLCQVVFLRSCFPLGKLFQFNISFSVCQLLFSSLFLFLAASRLPLSTACLSYHIFPPLVNIFFLFILFFLFLEVSCVFCYTILYLFSS